MRVTATLALLLTSPFVAHALDSGDYAVYSVVLDHLHLTPAGPLRFAIVRETISAPVLPCPAAKGIVQSAAPNQQRLEPGKLSIKEPYKLITENEAAEWIRNRFAPQVPTDPPGPKPLDPYPGSTDLIRLAQLFYNAEHTRAYLEPNPGCETIARISVSQETIISVMGRTRQRHCSECGESGGR